MWIMKLCLLIAISPMFTKEVDKKSVQFKWTGLECFSDNDFIVNVSCAVRAVRGQFGILEVNETIAKNMTDVKLHIQLFYKFGTIYRPYLFDFIVDICKYWTFYHPYITSVSPKGKIFAKDAVLDNNIEAILKKATLTVKSAWVHPCPYMPGHTSVKWSGDQTFATLISSFKFILPAGDHKWHWRIFDSKNHTYLSFKCKATIKALGLTDLSMLSMG